ncbi:MAG: homoserine kinase [Deltaproteobacteria bacterium]|nr:MAG: homoserine kinase [Deltaproteobacteria bacterium]
MPFCDCNAPSEKRRTSFIRRNPAPVKAFCAPNPIFSLTNATPTDSLHRHFGWNSGGLGRLVEMAVYTELGTRELAEIVDDYGLAKLLAASGIAAGSVNTSYLLETARGKHLLRIDEVKSELEVKRELDLLLFLRKHGFPCPQPIADRKGRHHREMHGKCLTLYRYVDGHTVAPTRLTAAQIENVGRVLADLHTIGKSYKKGIDNRFSYDRVADLYAQVRDRLPTYFKRIVRTLDDEVDYLQGYLENKLPKGVIHGDLFDDNVIFKGDKVVAMLDFEAACRGKFVFDLATAVNALCFDGESYQLKRFEALIAGYESLRALSLAEWDAFPNELRFSALRFTITRLHDFFLNPVDARARVNKDFREFYERLRILRRERDGAMEGLLMAMATGYDYRKYQKVKALEKKGSH